MPGIARKDIDTAGGIQLGGGQGFVRIEGHEWILLGDPIQGHGVPPHDAPVMAEGSPFVRIGGVPVCRAGHAATCGHVSTGSGAMRISD